MVKKEYTISRSGQLNARASVNQGILMLSTTTMCNYTPLNPGEIVTYPRIARYTIQNDNGMGRN